MAQRQVGQVHAIAVHRQPLGDARRHAAHIAVAQHRALGLAGGAGGVDHETGVVQPLAVQRLVQGSELGRLAPRAFGLDLGVGHDALTLRRRIGAQALGLHHDDAAQERQPVGHLQHLVGLLLVLAHHQLNIRVLQHVAHFLGRAGGVHAHRHRADRARSHLGQQPFHAVLGDDGDPSARAQTQGAQAQSHAAGPAPVFRPGHGLPDAEVLLPDGDGPRLAARLLAQHLRQRQGRPRLRRSAGDIHVLVRHDSQRLRRL